MCMKPYGEVLGNKSCKRFKVNFHLGIQSVCLNSQYVWLHVESFLEFEILRDDQPFNPVNRRISVGTVEIG